MKLKSFLTMAALLVAAVIIALNPTPQIMLGAVLLVGLVATATAQPVAGVFRVTLTVDEILADVMDAFKVTVPILNGVDGFATDFRSGTAVKGDTLKARISLLPTVRDYDATTGFKANAAESETLIADVPVTLDQLKHVPVKIDYITQLSSKVPLYQEAIRNIAYTLGKYVTDYALSKILAANFSRSVVVPGANYTLDTLEYLRTKLNQQGAMQFGRFALINSPAAGGLQSDARVASGDYYGQLNGASGYRRWTNMAGFSNVFEYPDLPANAEALNGFGGDKRAIVVANRQISISNAAEALGVPQVMQYTPMTDPDTGLQLTGVAWQEAGTGDVYVSVALLFGASAGAQGGLADSITDKAGYRVKES